MSSTRQLPYEPLEIVREASSPTTRRKKKYKLIASIIGIILAFIAFFLKASETNAIQKPITDKAEYKYIKLPNQLQMLLVSDPSVKMSAAGINVNVGSFSDPKTMPGLSHYIEHMLFINSQKYPIVDGYQKFVSGNSGKSNAFTAYEDTNYFFQIPNQNFEQALDMFAQFFIAPLFPPEYLEKEVFAINSEFEKNFQVDWFRMEYAIQLITNPESPFALFHCGSLETLKKNPENQGLEVYEEVVKHYNTHYSANLMTGVLMSNHSLDELERMAKEKFSAVRNNNLKPLVYNHGNLWGKLPRILTYIPIKKAHYLKLIFSIPPKKAPLDVKPFDYVVRLLQSAEPGTLFDILKSKGWLIEIISGYISVGSHSMDFGEIDCQLTNEGVKNIYPILQYIYAYFEKILKEGITKERYQEQMDITNIAFDYSPKPSEPIQIVQNLDMFLRYIEPKYVLKVGSVFLKYDEAVIKSFVKEVLDIENTLIVISSSDFQPTQDPNPTIYDPNSNTLTFKGTNQYNSFLRVNYSVYDPPESFTNNIKSFKGQDFFKLPEKNPYIPKKFTTLKPQVSFITSALQPRIIHSTPNSELWHSQFNREGFPIAYALFDICSSGSYKNVDSHISFSIWVQHVKRAVHSYTSHARDIGYSIDVTKKIDRMTLSVLGQSDKLPLLVKNIFSMIKDLKMVEKDFEKAKELVQMDIESYKRELLFRYAVYEMTVAMRDFYMSVEDIVKRLENFTYTDYLANEAKQPSSYYLMSLVIGNLGKDDAIGMVSHVEKSLSFKATKADLMPERYSYPKDKSFVYRDWSPFSDSNEHASVNYYFKGKKDVRSWACTKIIESTLSHYIFSTLRTNKGLGYVANAAMDNNLPYNGFFVFLQGPLYDPILFDKEIEAALKEFEKEISTLSDKSLEDTKKGIKDQLTENQINLKSRGQTWMKEIRLGTYDFAFHEKVVEEMQSITKQDLLRVFKDIFLFGGKLSYQRFSKKDISELPKELLSGEQTCSGRSETLINDLYELKKYVSK